MNLKTKIKYFFLDIIFPPSSDMKADRYLKYYGRPEKTKLFIDNQGNISSLLGTENLKKMLDDLKTLSNANKTKI